MGKSHQRGWVVSRGKKWYGYFRKTVFDPTTNRQKGDVISVVLGLKSQMKASEAREVPDVNNQANRTVRTKLRQSDER